MLFSILPRIRSPHLLRLLVVYEIIWDFLDNINERSASAGLANGVEMHRALIDALDPGHPMTDYYRHSPWYGDGGYLRALVTTCRAHCKHLPSYAALHRQVIQEATKGLVCAINHNLNTHERDAMLAAWAHSEFPRGHEASWFELTAAASTNLTIFALLALASEPTSTKDSATQITAAYFPWISMLTAMLDSYVDQHEDAANGSHSYIAHYPTGELATKRICQLMHRCLGEAGSLGNSEKHIIIAGCMFAMYLSKNSALEPATRRTTVCFLRAGGSLTHLLHPLLRLWRTVYGLRSA